MRLRRGVSRQMVRRHRRKTNPKSSLEKKVEGWLEENEIPFESQYPISRVHVDIFFEQTNTVVELQGCFWHGCTKCFPGKDAEHASQRRKDAKRFLFLRRLGYEVIVIWEHDVEHDFEEVKEKLKEAANPRYVRRRAA